MSQASENHMSIRRDYNPVRILIVEDEPDIQDLLSIQLKDFPGIEIVGIASDVNEAISMTIERLPELVLLDIQLPGKDGFAFLDELNTLQLSPSIIFVTAFENYAIRAIKKAAVDYLVKPVNKQELISSIERYIFTRERTARHDLRKLIELLGRSGPEKLKLNTRSGFMFVDPNEILFIEADGNYSYISLTTGMTETSSQNLGTLESLLKGSFFLRISRSNIINLNYLTRVDRKLNICELQHNDVIHKLKISSQRIRILEEYF